MKPEKRVRLLNLLCEGNSIRGTARLCETNIPTVLRHLTAAGEECRQFLHDELRSIPVKRIQCDEIWTFCGKKQGHLSDAEKRNPLLGDQFLFIAFEQDTKLICTYALGKRDSETTERFMEDLARRVRLPETANRDDRAQLSTDGWAAYPQAVQSSFGQQIKYGQLVKNYGEQSQEGRYGPPAVVDIDRRAFWGIDDPNTICTSHVERNNLTIPLWMKRFTRLTMGFSRKLDNLRAAGALHVFHYNYCRIHRTLKRTPAIASGLTTRVWQLSDLFGTAA